MLGLRNRGFFLFQFRLTTSSYESLNFRLPMQLGRRYLERRIRSIENGPNVMFSFIKPKTTLSCKRALWKGHDASRRALTNSTFGYLTCKQHHQALFKPFFNASAIPAIQSTREELETMRLMPNYKTEESVPPSAKLLFLQRLQSKILCRGVSVA